MFAVWEYPKASQQTMHEVTDEATASEAQPEAEPAPAPCSGAQQAAIPSECQRYAALVRALIVLAYNAGFDLEHVALRGHDTGSEYPHRVHPSERVRVLQAAGLGR